MKDFRVLIGLLGFFFIAFYTLVLNQHGFCYDEPYYLSNVDLLKNLGFGKSFLLSLKGPAGPLHASIHYLLSPVTHLAVKPTRMVNIIFGAIILFATLKTISIVNPENKNIAFLLFAIPMAYPTMGMALTEIPAMLFFCAALFLLLLFYKKDNSNYLLLLAGGFCFSAAILGRQPYLLCLCALFILPFYDFKISKKISSVIFVISALLIPCYAFSVWGELAPQDSGTLHTRGFLSPLNLILALGYSAMILFLLSPSFFLKINKKLALTYLSIFLLGIPFCVYFDLSFPPMLTFSQKVLPHFMLVYYGFIMCSLICTIGVFFAHSLAVRMTEQQKNFNYILVSFMLLAIVFSCIKVTHQFSSRYVFQAAPLFLIIASFHYKDNNYTKALNILGLIIGIISLVNYG